MYLLILKSFIAKIITFLASFRIKGEMIKTKFGVHSYSGIEDQTQWVKILSRLYKYCYMILTLNCHFNGIYIRRLVDKMI